VVVFLGHFFNNVSKSIDVEFKLSDSLKVNTFKLEKSNFNFCLQILLLMKLYLLSFSVSILSYTLVLFT